MLLLHSLTIEFDVRTEAESGLLFYMARINHADFATVQLKNGFPYFSYDLGSGDTNTMIPAKINDGQWHQVRKSPYDVGSALEDECLVAVACMPLVPVLHCQCRH